MSRQAEVKNKIKSLDPKIRQLNKKTWMRTNTQTPIHSERQANKHQVRLFRAGHTITEEEQEVTRETQGRA